MVLILTAGIVRVGSEAPLEQSKQLTVKKNTNSQFLYAYERMRVFEGNYANLKFDRGGETYGGVARNFNKNWYGWKHIDQRKRNGRIKHNSQVEEAEFWVLDYYLDIWVKEKFYLIENQDVADYLFDLRINSHYSGVSIIQKVLIDMGHEVEVDGVMGEQTIKAINNIEPQTLLIKVRDARIAFYKKIVKRNRNQKRFYKNWVNRANVLVFEYGKKI